MTQPTVFISYSHKDEKWKDWLRSHLKVLEQAGRITIWDDRQIDPSGKWFDLIKQVMKQAAAAVCLISPDYLASDFCVKEEIPYLLERCARDGMALILILVRPCAWEAFSWLKERQMVPRDGKSVSEDFQGKEDGVFAGVARHILKIVDDPNYRPPAPPSPRWSPPEKVDTSRLPQTGVELFGRQRELETLDAAWGSPHPAPLPQAGEGGSRKINVVSLVGWGGVGKSTLVNKWLEGMAADNYRGARRVYAWSFYSQGTGERVTSADLFIASALAWFGDPDPAQGSPWDKGQRLADLVRREKTLLLLDGLEPLQEGLAVERGCVKDPALAMLLAELARRNPGLAVITTREAVADLAPFPETTRQEDLEHIAPEAGRALLRVGGVQGTDAELEATSAAFGGHALALDLLAAYLHGIPGHPAVAAATIPDLDVPETEGRHPRRVMVAWAARLGGDGPEVEVLRMLGLFDRPADGAELAALRAAPPIPGLTGHVQGLPEGGWLRVLETLRRARLVARPSEHRPGSLDAHPLVREHFGQELRQSYPEAWREGHNRLYEYYKATAKEYPNTLEEMVPLFAAVVHGCQARRHQEALVEVYYRRVQRDGQTNFCFSKLGAIGAELAALSGFFDPPWSQPVAGLTEVWKSWVLSIAGFRLRALGRLREAAQPMQAGLDAHIAQEDWKNAASAAGNLSELTLTLGDLAGALDFARQSTELADRSGDTFERLKQRCKLAVALHQAGRLAEAEAAFREAEEMQKEWQQQFPLLYSVQGYRYCDLLLGRGEVEDVQRRASQTVKWAKQYGGGLLSIALDHLTLGRAALAETFRISETPKVWDEATDYLDQAVNSLRQAGIQEFLIRGLLARAALRRAMGDLERAQADLDEAFAIAMRGGMRLHEADCRLEYARLYLARGEVDQARTSLAAARKMVEEMGYHRRDGDVKELEKQLGEEGV
jgi:tetratricopeptide (TPR) repeat protein